MENKGRNISFSWAATIAIVLATLFMVLFSTVYKLPEILKYESEMEESILEKDAKFLEKSTINSEDDAPYLETGIDNIYYTCNANGDINFYKFEKGKYENYRSSGSTSITLPGTDNGKSTDISFVSFNGQTMGFGVYSNKGSKKFPYAFLKVVPNKITDNYDYIAFVDKTIPDYYNNNKKYETAYAFSKNREIEEIFELKDETSFIPIELTMELGDGFYYFTKNETGDKYSLYIKNTIHDKAVAISDSVVYPQGFFKDGELYILEKTPLCDAEFCMIRVTADQTGSIVKQFSSPVENYLVNGNYILDLSTKSLYDFSSNTTQLMNISVSLSGVESFAVSEGAARVAFAGKFFGGAEKLYFYEFATDNMKVMDSKNLYLSGNPNISFADNYVTFLSPASNASHVINIAILWSDVFK